MRRTPFLLLVLVVLLGGCGEGDALGAADTTGTAAPSATAPAGEPEPGEGGVLEPSPPFGLDRLTLAGPGAREIQLDVFVADTREQRARGLMFRESLPAFAGMDFRYDEDNVGGFWMKNTLLPLSIAFYDADGVILVILDMDPCEADPCPSYDPGVTYRGALEVNQGAFEEWGVEPGWRVERAG